MKGNSERGGTAGTCMGSWLLSAGVKDLERSPENVCEG